MAEPGKAVEQDDPMALVGVELPAGDEAMRDMAYVFAEEFARLGYGEVLIGSVFRNPFYRGAHQAYRVLGQDAVAAIIAECVRAWNPRGAAREPAREGA